MAATPPDPRWCRVHVEGPRDLQELRDAIATAFGGSADAYGVNTSRATILVEDADDFSPTRRFEFPVGYLWFQRHVEPLFADDVDLDEAIRLVARLLEALWAQGWAAVAVCNYEDRLPHGGGYDTKDVPWPSP